MISLVPPRNSDARAKPRKARLLDLCWTFRTEVAQAERASGKWPSRLHRPEISAAAGISGYGIARWKRAKSRRCGIKLFARPGSIVTSKTQAHGGGSTACAAAALPDPSPAFLASAPVPALQCPAGRKRPAKLTPPAAAQYLSSCFEALDLPDARMRETPGEHATT